MSVEITLGLIAGLIIGVVAGYFLRRWFIERSLLVSQKEAQRIIKDAEREAVSIRKTSMLEAKEDFFKEKTRVEKGFEDRRVELQRLENRLQQKEENLEKRIGLVESKEVNINRARREVDHRAKRLKRDEEELKVLMQKQRKVLEDISGMTMQEARDNLMAGLIDEAKRDSAVMVRSVFDKAQEEADQKAKEVIITAIQRCASDFVSETTVSVVNLPNDEMKGRIIGREGRNIRAFETATGIDLIIDDTPEAVILSGFHPIRREVAKRSLERLITDGRIHPARIEEVVKKIGVEVQADIKEIGERTAFDMGIHNLHKDLVRLIGQLQFRSSYGQNVLNHSIEVAQIAAMMTAELNGDVAIAKRSGLLHDIGKAVDFEIEGAHTKIGADLAIKYNESKAVINAIEAHHNDTEFQTLEAAIVQAADALSAARPGARRETLEGYIKRLQNLEAIADSFSGVSKSYAIQAGREVRIIVEPDRIDDNLMFVLSRDIAKKIESELEYPGEIRVTAIRETRAIEYAR